MVYFRHRKLHKDTLTIGQRYPYEVYGDENIPYRVNKEIFLKNIVKMNK